MDVPQKKTIDGFTFELQILPAWTHTDASLMLMQIMGPAIKPIALLMNKATTPQLDLELIGALIMVLRGAPRADVLELSKTMLAECVVSGDLGGTTKLAKLMPIFDQLLRGKLMTIYKLIAWAVQVNFTGFFDDLKSALPVPAPSPKEAASPSPSLNQSADAGPAAG